MIIKEHYMNMLHFRHATKEFDTARVVSTEDLMYVLEAGRLSPSSFGIEPWQFAVIRDGQLKEKLQKACFSQLQVGTASAVIVVLARKDLYIDDGFVEPLLRRDGNEYYDKFAKDFYTGYTNTMESEDIANYADKQCYLASMNLMNAAAILGIDSCPIGGFEEDKVLDIIGEKSKNFAVSLVIPLGYRAIEPKTKYRRVFNEVVKFIDT